MRSFRWPSYASVLTLLVCYSEGVNRVDWVPKDNVDFSVLTPAGWETRSGDWSLYVARALHMSTFLPGKYHPNPMYNIVWYSYNGSDFVAYDYEFLVAPPGSLSWLPGFRRNVPEPDKLIYGGLDPVTRETQYVCRAWYGDSEELILGRYSYDDGGCFVAHYGENKFDSFEILALNAYGEAIKAGRGNTGPTSSA